VRHYLIRIRVPVRYQNSAALISSFASLSFRLSPPVFSRATRNAANARYQRNNLRHRSASSWSKVARAPARDNAATREILIINSIELRQIEIKPRSNRFSRTIARARTLLERARAVALAYVSHAGINIRDDITFVISKRNCERGRIGEFGFYVTMD